MYSCLGVYNAVLYVSHIIQHAGIEVKHVYRLCRAVDCEPNQRGPTGCKNRCQEGQPCSCIVTLSVCSYSYSTFMCTCIIMSACNYALRYMCADICLFKCFQYYLYHSSHTNQRHCPVVILHRLGISARSTNCGS